jgi:hypothetical protein
MPFRAPSFGSAPPRLCIWAGGSSSPRAIRHPRLTSIPPSPQIIMNSLPSSDPDVSGVRFVSRSEWDEWARTRPGWADKTLVQRMPAGQDTWMREGELARKTAEEDKARQEEEQAKDEKILGLTGRVKYVHRRGRVGVGCGGVQGRAWGRRGKQDVGHGRVALHHLAECSRWGYVLVGVWGGERRARREGLVGGERGWRLGWVAAAVAPLRPFPMQSDQGVGRSVFTPYSHPPDVVRPGRGKREGL